MTQPTNPPPVKIRQINWKQLVEKTAGSDATKPEPAYEFSNGRQFEDTGSHGGPYQS